MRIHKALAHHTNVVFKKTLFHLLVIRSRVFHRLIVKKTRVTIFGSCRQDSIYSHFRVSCIRDALTYPHYSKEIIQAIEYCKDTEIKIPNWAFRNTQIGLKLGSRLSLNRAFQKSDVFVIEIASMLEYIYEGVYLHHEVYDNPLNNGSHLGIEKARILRREQTLSELSEDLEKIIELLNGKQVVFACHISTRSTGRRAELTRTLVDFCTDRGIPFFNPSEMLEYYNERDLFVQEPVLSHLSEFGHRIAGYRYKEIIELRAIRMKTAFNPLVQTLEPPPDEIGGFTSGFGDYLNGALKIHEIAAKLKRTPLVDFGDSAMSTYLVNKYVNAGQSVTPKIFHEDPDTSFVSVEKVFTNKKHQKPLSEASRDFVYRNCLSKKLVLTEEISKAREALGLTPKSYRVLHIRVSDDFDVNPEPRILAHIVDLLNKEDFFQDVTLIILSNSNAVREHFKEIGLKSPQAYVQHSADPAATKESIRQMLSEFFLISEATSVYQISTYEWGSGFSSLAAELFDIPIQKIRVRI